MSDKDSLLQTKVTKQISDIVEKIATEQGIKPSEYVRNLIIQDIDRRTIITTAVKEEIAKAGGK
jgi:hypothetical protein